MLDILLEVTVKDQGPLSAGHGEPPETKHEDGVPPASGAAEITLPSVTPRPASDADTELFRGARPASSNDTQVARAKWDGDEAPVSASAFLGAPRRGDRIGQNQRFEIIEKLGEGGMGHVFRAIDSHLDRTVAVKFILHTQQLPLEQLINQLEREARVTARLSHENIVAIFDMGAYNGVPFLVMELLDGQSLDVIMERSRLSVGRAVAIMQQVARGLAHAHQNGIVHRDLKPSNVFILRDGRAKILDFGISRFEIPLPTNLPDDLNPTLFGAGTPAYMAPERWRDGPQDGRTDIWAAGVMFYQMLTGKLPYTVPELLQFAVRRRSIAPSVRALVPGLPEEADRIVATALNHEPEGRFQSGAELEAALRELEALLGQSATELGPRSGLGRRVERRPLTLLACDLERSDDGLELDDAIEQQLRFHEACATAVKHWGGLLGTPLGGRVFGCFGYPIARETDAEHAVRAGQQIMQILRAQAREQGGAAARLDVKVAVHSGIMGLPNQPAGAPAFPAMVGSVPSELRGLAGSAASAELTISQATLDLTAKRFIVAPVEPSASAATPLRAYRVLGEVDSASRFEQARAAELTPLQGRERELSILRQLWEEAKDGRGQMVVIRGDAGIGKSRIVHALRSRVSDEQNVRLTSQCRPHFRNTAFRPLIELILRSMSISRDDPRAVQQSKLRDQLARLGFGAEAAPLFAPLLSIQLDAPERPLELTPEKIKLKTIEGLVSMLLRRALERPVLFIIEDMHWVDHSTIEVLNALIEVVPAARLLVVLTCRPEFRSPWSPRRHLHQLSLDRLPADATEAMIRRAAGDRALPPELVARLATVTDGVPLFVEELTRMVVESGVGQADRPSPRRLEIPSTLHELLLARLDRLPSVGKEVAQLGAVLGRDFSYALVRAVSELDELSLQQGLDVLSDAGLLQRLSAGSSTKYQFKHALIQQAAYQSLVKSERRAHHARAADALTQVFSDTAALEPELLAYHHAEAGNVAQAVEYWETAGQQATQRSGLIEAIDHYRHALSALALLPPGPARDKRELALLLGLGSPLMSVHGYAAPEVEKTYARARELARAGGAERELFPAMQGLWQYYYVRGMLPASRALGQQLLEIARDSRDSTLLLLAHRAVASSAFLQGDYEPCRSHTAEGMKLYDVKAHGALALKTGHDPGVAHGVYQAWSLWMLGCPDQALAVVTHMVELARRLSHPLTTAYALCFAALIRNHRADHAEARALSEEALAITEPNKFALWSAWATMQLGWALCGAGQLSAGIPQMTRGLEGWKSTGARVGFTFFPVTLAEMCLRAGRLESAEQLLAEAAPMIAQNAEHFYEPELLRLRAELSRKQAPGADGQALQLLERGLSIARARKGKSWELRLVTLRAELLAAGGEAKLAADELSTVLESFREGHGTGDLRAARALLDSLRGGRIEPSLSSA